MSEITKETACPLQQPAIRCGSWCEWFIPNPDTKLGNCVVKTLTGVLQNLYEVFQQKSDNKTLKGH